MEGGEFEHSVKYNVTVMQENVTISCIIIFPKKTHRLSNCEAKLKFYRCFLEGIHSVSQNSRNADVKVSRSNLVLEIRVTTWRCHSENYCPPDVILVGAAMGEVE